MHDTQKNDLFSVCVSKLVMESKEFELLLGRVLPDGTVKPGAVEKFQSDTSQVIDFVASDAEEKGLYEDAIHLYDLAKVCVCVHVCARVCMHMLICVCVHTLVCAGVCVCMRIWCVCRCGWVDGWMRECDIKKYITLILFSCSLSIN